jgi:PadR family transcriptional regulator, regulatory protein PadR
MRCPLQAGHNQAVPRTVADPQAEAESDAERMVRVFFLGFVKIHILHHAAREPLYGVQFIAELREHGYHLSPGTLYPLLHSLEAAGYVEREPRVVKGKVRKYYRATAKGEQALAEAKEKIRMLVDEVFEPGLGAVPVNDTAVRSVPAMGKNGGRGRSEAPGR